MRNTITQILLPFLLCAVLSIEACNTQPKDIKPSFSKNYTFVIQDVMATAKFANADVKVITHPPGRNKKPQADIKVTLYNSMFLPATEQGLDSLARKAVKIFTDPILNLSEFDSIKICFEQEEQFPKIESGKRSEFVFASDKLAMP
jgi:hypothetical protein